MAAMGYLRSQVRKRSTASVSATGGDMGGSGSTIMVALPTIAHAEVYPSVRLSTLVQSESESDGYIFV